MWRRRPRPRDAAGEGERGDDRGHVRVLAAADDEQLGRRGGVGEGQPLMNIVSRRVYMTANFKETQLARMRAGQPVDLKVDSYLGVTYRGHVDSVMNGTESAFAILPPENATGNFVKVGQCVPVKIVLDGNHAAPLHRLSPRMSVMRAVGSRTPPPAAPPRAKGGRGEREP